MISNGPFYLAILFSILLNFSIPLYAQDSKKNAEAPVTDIFYLCKRDKSTRWLRTLKLENGKCNTLYAKEGYLQLVGSATYFSSCEGILNSVKKNIEEGGFVCVLTPKYSILEL